MIENYKNWKRAFFFTFPAISPEMNNSLNTFYMRAKFKKLILNLVPFIAIYPGYYGPHTIFVFVVASYNSWKLLLKTKLWHCSCCHRYLDKQIKTYQRLHENRVHLDFSLKGCQIYLVPFNMTMTLDFQYGHPCLVITYLIQNNSFLLELNREYFDDLWLKWNSYFKFKNSIQLPVSLRIMVIKLIQIYLLFIWYFG